MLYLYIKLIFSSEHYLIWWLKRDSFYQAFFKTFIFFSWYEATLFFETWKLLLNSLVAPFTRRHVVQQYLFYIAESCAKETSYCSRYRNSFCIKLAELGITLTSYPLPNIISSKSYKTFNLVDIEEKREDGPTKKRIVSAQYPSVRRGLSQSRNNGHMKKHHQCGSGYCIWHAALELCLLSVDIHGELFRGLSPGVADRFN